MGVRTTSPWGVDVFRVYSIMFPLQACLGWFLGVQVVLCEVYLSFSSLRVLKFERNLWMVFFHVFNVPRPRGV